MDEFDKSNLIVPFYGFNHIHVDKIPKVFHCIQGHECIYAFDAKLIFRIAIKWMKQHQDMASLSVCTWIENSFQVCIGLILLLLLLTFARNRIASKYTITTSLFLFWKRKKTTFFFRFDCFWLIWVNALVNTHLIICPFEDFLFGMLLPTSFLRFNVLFCSICHCIPISLVYLPNV